MNKEFSKRLKRLTPEGGGVDLTFSLASSGQAGKVASTLALKVLGQSEKGLMIVKSVTISAMANDLADANERALEDALSLLGV